MTAHRMGLVLSFIACFILLVIDRIELVTSSVYESLCFSGDKMTLHKCVLIDRMID